MTRDLFRTRIKFCGFTRPGDVRLASELGVDAIGLVFAHASRRRVRVEDARAIRNALAPLVDVVALFANNSIDEVREAVRQVRPTLLQFHGDEDDGFCRAFGLPYAKAIPMEAANESDARALQTRYPDRSARMVSLQRVRGMLGGRRGSFVLQGSETIRNGRIEATWFVVPDTGTGDLCGLRGEGGFEGEFGKSSNATLDYWFA